MLLIIQLNPTFKYTILVTKFYLLSIIYFSLMSDFCNPINNKLYNNILRINKSLFVNLKFVCFL